MEGDALIGFPLYVHFPKKNIGKNRERLLPISQKLQHFFNWPQFRVPLLPFFLTPLQFPPSLAANFGGVTVA